MRLSCLAVVTLLFGLVGFEALGTGTAPGQSAPVQPAATTVPAPGQAPSAWTPAMSGLAGYPAAEYGALTQVYRTGPASHKEAELEKQSRALAQKYGKTENRDERDKIREQLNDALRQLFDAQQQRRKDEIKQIEEQLKKLQDLMRKREDSKSTIVQRRLEQLLQEADGLGWTGSDPLSSTLPHSLFPSQSTPAPTPGSTIRR
jgi:flagellar hook-basal body complex protein FliE